MKRIGTALITTGIVAIFLLVSTDDYYTMELHQFHTIDWKGFLATAAVVAAGALLCWAGDHFTIQVRRKED